MKSQIEKKPDPNVDHDDDEDSSEVAAGGASIATGKKSKMTIILASSVLITTVLYILFFKSEPAKKENLEEVVPSKSTIVAPSETGKSSFELAKPEEKSKDEVELLSKPAAPEVPTLPELPAGALAPQDQVLVPNQQQALRNPLTPLAPVAAPSAPPAQPEHQGMLQAMFLPPVKPEQQTEQHPMQQVQPMQQQAQQPQKNNQPEKKKELDPRYSPIIVFSGTAAGTPSRGVGYEKNIVKLKEDSIDELKTTATKVTATIIKDRAHMIAQGKLLTAVLETAIHTEIPGSVRAVVSRDVYGEAGNDVLIPRGSRLFGAYTSKITRGQARVEIGWTRLIRPDGVDLAISFKASDQFGRAGIGGEVDNKYGAIITNSILTSILAVGSVAAVQKLLNDNSQTTTTTNPTQGSTTTSGNATNQALAGVSKTIIDTVGQIIGSTIDLTPVIRIPQGTKITVIVNADINVPSMSNK
jgi:type IV secretion system protein VirB10